MNKWCRPLIISASLLCAAGFIAVCHSCSRFFERQATQTSEDSQSQVDLHAGLDVTVVERVRVPTRDVIAEVRIGKLTVGKKKTGFIRLGSFNEVRLSNVDIVVARAFFSAPVRSPENVTPVENRLTAPETGAAEGARLPPPPPPSLAPRPQAPIHDARLGILKKLKERVNDHAEGAYAHGKSISSFSIRGLRIILDDDTADGTVIITAQQAKIAKDHIGLGQRGGVEMTASWGDAAITCSQAEIGFAPSATVRMPTANVRCGDYTMRYASLELPLDALVSRQAWDKHFRTTSVD